jgi:hypothetical protein
MEMEILHTMRGDKKKKFDTATEAGRKEAKALIDKLLKSGTAIFLERKKKTMRLKGYDPTTDSLIVEAEVRGEQRDVRTRGRKAKTVAVAPVAGGGVA